MRPELHPDAAKNFDEKAQALLAVVVPEPRQVPSKPPTHTFRPGGAVAATLDVGDIGNLKITGKSDQLGRRTARYFDHEGRRFGLEDEKYKALARISEGVQKTKAFRDLVSVQWVEDTILDWMKARWTGEAVSALGDYLTERCQEDVKEHNIWLPVSHLTIESDLPFGTVVFRTVSKEIMDRWEEDWQEAKRGRDAEYAAQVDYYFVRERTNLQGLAAATMKVTAEPKRALEVALRESEKAVAALRIYHIAAAMFPEVTSYCVLLGREHVDGVKHLEMEGGRVRGVSDQDTGGPVLNWHLSDEEVSKNRRSFGFDEVSEMLALRTVTKFQEVLLDSLLLYSRSTLEKDLTGRLVYMLVAMESLLLRNDMEPTQQNVGERMAFVIASTLEERKAAIRNLKDAYDRTPFVVPLTMRVFVRILAALLPSPRTLPG